MANIQWIKVSTDILHNRKIQALRYQKNGNEVILLWFYLMVLAGQVNDAGKIYFTESLPYDADKLHTEFKVKKSIVNQGLEYFRSNNMIDVDNKGIIYMLNWEEYQNVDQMELIRQQNRIRQQRYALRHRQPNANITPAITLDNAVDKNRIEKNREEEIRKEEIKPISKSEADFIKSLDDEPKEILYDQFTDKLMLVNVITSVDANLHHLKIKEYFSRFTPEQFSRYVKSFVEHRVNGKYILKMVGATNENKS
jgi:predicted phage replisome organizer